MFNNKEEAEHWLKKYNISNYKINEDLSVYLDGKEYINKNGKFTTKEGIEHWLSEIAKNSSFVDVQDYEIQNDLVINNYKIVDLFNLNLSFLPVNFGTVGVFKVDRNNFTSFEGFPHTVLEIINLNNNKFTTLQGYKATIGGDVLIFDNPLLNLRNDLLNTNSYLYCNIIEDFKEGYNNQNILKVEKINNYYKSIDLSEKLNNVLPIKENNKKIKYRKGNV